MREEKLPDKPADPQCLDCKGAGWYYQGEWATTCECRYNQNDEIT